MKPQLVTEAKAEGKKVLVRVDFNLPISGSRVTDSSRIKASKPTIDWLTEKGAAVFLISHFGEVDGERDKKYSLRKIVSTISKELGQKVFFVEDCIGSVREKALKKSKPGEVYLLENTRYHAGEKKNEAEFSKALAAGCDLYVNDAFSTAHRAHASTVGVSEYLSSFMGLSFQKEYMGVEKILNKPNLPFVAVVGGAKISSKIDVLERLIKKVDVLIVGGGMANNFLAAEGYEVGRSFYEEDFLDSAERISKLAHDEATEFLLPDDVLTSDRIGRRARVKIKAIDEVEKEDIIVDVGPRSIAKFAEPLKFAGKIFWNGPMGVAEYKASQKGTEATAKIISESKGVSLVGGGDTLAAVRDHNLKFDFVSTGGGATLELVAGHKLPGLEALK